MADDEEDDEDEDKDEDEDEDEGCLHQISLVARVGDKIERLDQHSLFRGSLSPVHLSSLASSLSLYGGYEDTAKDEDEDEDRNRCHLQSF